MGEDGKMRCLFCGGELVWDSDFNLNEVRDADDDDNGVLSVYHSSVCGRDYEISDPVKSERETTYKDYWNG